jgi:hypothetical protein
LKTQINNDLINLKKKTRSKNNKNTLIFYFKRRYHNLSFHIKIN